MIVHLGHADGFETDFRVRGNVGGNIGAVVLPSISVVTCARASGLCEVVHGEDVQGKVEENAWTLLCPEHTEQKPIDAADAVIDVPVTTPAPVMPAITRLVNERDGLLRSNTPSTTLETRCRSISRPRASR